MLAAHLTPFAVLPYTGRHRTEPPPVAVTATALPLAVPADVVARPAPRAARSLPRPARRAVSVPAARTVPAVRRPVVAAPVRRVAAAAVVHGDAAAVVAFARAQIGKPYEYGAAGPDSYDCSGLVLAAYLRIGVHLPHNAAAFYGVGKAVSRDALQPGDVLILDGGKHAAVYVGDGMMIHAPKPGDRVKLAPIWSFSAARRIVG